MPYYIITANEICEVSQINKQKFLTELEKLLSFMYQEDRDTAIAMYEKMFQLSPDESALISALISPTRQAVQLARAYDSNERKLSMSSSVGNENAYVAGEEPAPFVLKIKEIFEDVLDAMPDTEDSVPEEEISSDTVETAVTEVVEETVSELQEEKSQVDIFSDQVDEFLKDFKIKNFETDASAEEVKEEAEEQDTVETVVETPVIENTDETSTEITDNAETDDKGEELQETEVIPEKTKEKKKKASNKKESAPENNGKLSGSALALFLLIAIPLTALGLIVIFALAIAVLAVAAAGFLMTSRILAAAFGSFKVFADVLVVTGTGFVLGALSLLVLWTAIWLAFGVSAKMINGIINLAVKICTKEDSGK